MPLAWCNLFDMSMVLVTGINGFVGQHLARELASNGYRVAGADRAPEPKANLDIIDRYLGLDLTDLDACSKVDFSDIDYVIHLAGLAAVGPSFDDPMLYINVNVGIEVNLFETALKQKAAPRFLIISSGSLYDPKTTLPLTEESHVEPNSPYAVSKLGQEQMATYYESRGFKSVIARPFNHIGPGQMPGFIVPDLAKQVVDFEQGKVSEITVGNLDAKRDYTDVRDIAKAYRLLLEKGKSGQVYNICSGRPLSGHEILDGLLSQVSSKPEVKQDSSKMRPSDTPVIYGSYNKLKEDTGWEPGISIDKTLADAITDWRSREK